MATVNLNSLAPKPPDPRAGGTMFYGPSESGLMAPNVSVPAVNSSSPSALSYAKVVASSAEHLHGVPLTSDQPRPKAKPRFPPIHLPARQVGVKGGVPAVSFSSSEMGACEKLFEHSIIAKFTVGRPHLAEIQRTFKSHWTVARRASISDIWDSRHVLIIFDSEAEVRVALSSPLNKVGHAYFRLFRWFPDYDPKRESTTTTIWVRLPNLPLYLYLSSFIDAIVSTFGYFVSVDDRTNACTSRKFARACVELDVTKPIPKTIWINLPDNRSFWQDIEVESKLAYCNHCKVHGHSFDICRKRKDVKAKLHNNTKGDSHGNVFKGSVYAHMNALKNVPQIESMGDCAKAESNIAGSSSMGGADMQWQQKKTKRNAARGVLVAKVHDIEDTLTEKVTGMECIGEEVLPTEQNAEVNQINATHQIGISNSDHPHIMNELVPTNEDGTANVNIIKDIVPSSNSSSSELFLSEGTGQFVHPKMAAHYNQIQEKAGIFSDQPNAQNKGFITTRKKQNGVSGSKPCLSGVSQ